MAIFARACNFAIVVAVMLMLVIAFWVQIVRGELPCALCVVQRAALLSAGYGFLLNARFGASEKHYGIAILSAMVGAAAAGYEVLRHLATGAAPAGTVFFGLHIDAAMFVVFCLLILLSATLLFVAEQFLEGVQDVRPNIAVQSLAWVFVAFTLAAAVATLLQCGVGPCPDTPSGYQLPWK
jgi:disulfide bond formation protein DsbB